MRIIKYNIALFIGFALGIVIGFRYAVLESYLYDAQFNAFKTLTEINALNRQQIKELTESKEAELDAYIQLHGWYLESNISWLLFKSSEEKEMGKLEMRKVVKYRTQHPAPPNILQIEKFPTEIQESSTQNKLRYQNAIDAYKN